MKQFETNIEHQKKTKLDLSRLSISAQLALLSFYDFLKEQEQKEAENKNKEN